MKTVEVKPGIVLSYDRNNARGVVSLAGREIRLGSSYFHSWKGRRLPQAGDEVDVVRSLSLCRKPVVVYVRPRRTPSEDS